MPVRKCSNGKYRIGDGPCMYHSKDKAERTYAAYRAKSHTESDSSWIESALDKLDGTVDEMATPSKRMAKQTFYHGTKTQKSADEIWKSGILPDLSTTPKDNVSRPVEGRVYLATDIKNSIPYLLGGAMAGSEIPPEWIKKDGQYGYLFVIRGSDLVDVHPDEDQVGEAVHDRAFPWIEDYLDLIRAESPEEDDEEEDEEGNMVPQDDPYRHHNDLLAQVDSGEYAAWIKAGHVILATMTDDEKHDVIKKYGNVAHEGKVMPAEMWQLDKAKSEELKADGSNFFDLAKKIGTHKANESNDPKYDASVKGAFDFLTKQKAFIPEARTKQLKIDGKPVDAILMAGGPGFKIYALSDAVVVVTGRKQLVVKETDPDFKGIMRYVNLKYQPASEHGKAKEWFDSFIAGSAIREVHDMDPPYDGMHENSKELTSDDVIQYLDSIAQHGDYLDNQYADIGHYDQWVLKKLRIDDLDFSQERVASPESQEIVQNYMALDTEAPPIIVVPQEEGLLRIVDGYHRVAVADLKGKSTIMAYVPVVEYDEEPTLDEKYLDTVRAVGGQIEVFVNPTKKEMRELEEHDSVRAFIDGDQLYVWSPMGALHQEIREHFKLGKEALPLMLYMYQGKVSDAQVTDNSESTIWHHNRETADFILNSPALVGIKDPAMTVSYYDEAIVGSWEDLDELVNRQSSLSEAVEETPIEDLTKEHGIFRRCLMIYEKLEDQIEIAKSVAQIIKEFIHDYHEELEEKYIFPRLTGEFQAIGKILEAQHELGKTLTDKILKSNDWTEVKDAIKEFIAMARPHAAEEDSLIYPEFIKVMSQDEYSKLGKTFEVEEEKLTRSFSEIEAAVFEIEKSLGVEWGQADESDVGVSWVNEAAPKA